MRKSRFRLFAALATLVGVLLLVAGPAMATTITAPPPGFPVPGTGSNNACCGQVAISGTGFPASTLIFTMVCDGTSPSAPGWDPNVNCDSGTSPAGEPSDTSGNVTFPANISRGLVFFDGTNPSGTFDCLYPTEADPPDGLPHWGNGSNPPCQIILTTNTTAVTSNQVLESFILPTPGAVVPETHYAIFLPIGALLLLGGGYVLMRLRNHRPSAGVAV